MVWMEAFKAKSISRNGVVVTPGSTSALIYFQHLAGQLIPPWLEAQFVIRYIVALTRVPTVAQDQPSPLGRGYPSTCIRFGTFIRKSFTCLSLFSLGIIIIRSVDCFDDRVSRDLFLVAARLRSISWSHEGIIDTSS